MRILGLVLIPLSLLFAHPAVASDCSAQACVDCMQNSEGIGSCRTVSYDASCSCSLDVAYPEFCILEGSCDYAPAGGDGGGGFDDEGATCYRPIGGWCPAQCSRCETVYWY